MTTIDTSTEAVERLLENVTPGPWQAETWEDYETEYGFEKLLITSESGISVVEGCGCCGSPKGGNVRDTHFIIAARDLVPALLKERDDLRAKLVAVVTDIKDIDANLTHFISRKPQQVMLPETVEFVRDMVRAALAADIRARGDA